MRSQRLQVSANLVGHIASVRGAVGAGQHNIHLRMLHQVPAGIVCNYGVRHAMLAQLPGCQARTLVARARLVHPHMHSHTGIVRCIHRRRCRPVIHKRQPAGIAMRQHIHRRTALACADFCQQRLPVHTDAPAIVGVLVCDGLRSCARQLDAHINLRWRCAQSLQLARQRPLKVYSRGTRYLQGLRGALKRSHKVCRAALRSLKRSQINAIAGSSPNQAGTAHMHVANGRGHIRHACDVFHHKPMRQPALVDDLHAARVVRGNPNGSAGLAVDLHDEWRARRMPPPRSGGKQILDVGQQITRRHSRQI